MKALRSLQARLLLLLLAGVAGFALLLAAASAWTLKEELDELLDAHLAEAAALLVVQQAGLPHQDGRVLDAPQLHRYASKAVFQVFHQGQLVLRSARAPQAPLLASFANGFHTVTLQGRHWRVFAAQGADPELQVLVGEPLAERLHLVGEALENWPLLWGGALLALLLALALSLRRALRPLRRLQADLQARQPDSLQPLQLPGAPSELAPAVQALNALFVRIAALLAGERRFTADAAHELRTPIAAIRAQAQVALGAQNPAEREHALRATLQGCDRAAHLVDQLLTLARLEGGAAMQREPVDLAQLAREQLAELAPQALARQQQLSLDAQPQPLPGDAALLRVLLRNLVDNALRHSPPGARIEVQVGGDALLTVEDSGPGLDAATAAGLGQRFVRGAEALGSGSGLGWSIAQRIAAGHGLSLRAEPSARLGGLAVRLQRVRGQAISKRAP